MNIVTETILKIKEEVNSKAFINSLHWVLVFWKSPVTDVPDYEMWYSDNWTGAAQVKNWVMKERLEMGYPFIMYMDGEQVAQYKIEEWVE